MYKIGANFSQSQAQLDALVADFSGMDKLEKIVDKTLDRLKAQSSAQINSYKSGNMSANDFDQFFATLIRKELGKVLGIVRNKAIARARAAGAGSASTAILRRMYRDEFVGNINIAGNRKRICSRKRVVEPPDGGKSGIHRSRSIKARTKQLREYYGPDRSFILRILSEGRDVYMATPEGPTGKRSRATYGKRGAIAGTGFFHSMSNDMEQAARQLGDTLVGYVEKWVEQNFETINE